MDKELINSLREKYNLRDIESVAYCENIELVYLDFPESIKGVYYSQNEINVIAINKNLLQKEKIETFWHEYYHYLKSVGNFISIKFCLNSIKNFITKDEDRADEFVARLLIDSKSENDTLEELEEKYNVTYKLAEKRLQLKD